MTWRGHTLTCGATGMGKTTFAVAQWLADTPRLKVALDPKGDIAEIVQRRFGARPAIARTPSELLEKVRSGTVCLCYQNAFSPDDYARFGEALHRICTARPGCSLLADEMSVGYPNMVLPADKRGFQRLVLQGRAPAGVRIMGVAQRPASVNTDFRGNVSAVAAFRLPWKQDREAVAHLLGDGVLPVLGQLAEHEFVLGKTNGEFRKYRLDASGAATQI